MTKHTPVPWHIEVCRPFDYPPPSGSRYEHCIIGVGEGTLRSSFHHVADCGIASSDEVKATAEFIVKACNNHDSLLSALQKCEDLLTELALGGAENPELLIARNAIANAKEVRNAEVRD